MLKTKLFSSLVALVIGLTNAPQATSASPQWQTLSPGLDYLQSHLSKSNPFAKLHVFRFRLNQYSLQLALNNRQGQHLTLQQLATKEQALIAVNGGFFTPDLKPLGLRVVNGKRLNPLKPISWWGVFYIKNNRPYLVSYRHYRHSQRTQFAIQAGPRLIINGKIPKLKPGLDARTAIGFDKKRNVYLVVSEFNHLSTSALARFMKDKLNCRYALNLDGGSSTQLFTQVGEFSKRILGYASISDTVFIKKIGKKNT